MAAPSHPMTPLVHPSGGHIVLHLPMDTDVAVKVMRALGDLGFTFDKTDDEPREGFGPAYEVRRLGPDEDPPGFVEDTIGRRDAA